MTERIGLAMDMKVIAGRRAAVFTCNGCGANGNVTVSGKLNPEMAARRMRREGWEADGYVASRVKCPACIAAKLSGRKGESPKEGEANVRKHPANAPATASEQRGDAPPMIAAAMVPGGTRPRPTTSQRATVRTSLELYFDAAAGAYIEDWTDARVAAEAGIDEETAAAIRESAYGPLRDPAVAAAIERLAGLEAELRFQVEQRTEIEKRLAAAKAQMEGISALLDRTEGNLSDLAAKTASTLDEAARTRAFLASAA